MVIALFGALIGPFFVDWTKYTQDFEREASRIIGQPVHVAGDAKVRILPFPTVTFADLSIGEYADGTAMMTVDGFSMDTELMPFLRGQVRIVEMRLIKPQLTVRVNENGTIDWTDRKQLLVNPENVELNRMRVENATIRLEGLAGGRVLEAEQVNADVSARSLVGPWRIEGNGQLEERQTAFEITTGRVQESGSLRVRLTASRERQPYELSLDGPVALQEDVLGWSGNFRLSPQAGSVETDEALPVLATGDYSATPNRIDIVEYRLEIGDREDPYAITGDAWANIREEILFQAKADGRQIDLDRLDDTAAQAGSTDLQARIAAVRTVLDKVPVPSIDGRIDLFLPAIVAGDTVIRELKALVRPDGQAWRIERLETIFPGNTVVEASGRLGTGADFGFSGELLLASRQPTGFANWLAGKNNAALRRLSSAGLSADATITDSQFTLENLEMLLDGVRLTGRLQRLVNAGERPAIIAELTGERIDTDELYAVYSLMESGEDNNLTSHDLDIKLGASILEGQGMSARDVEARIRIEAGSVSIDSLNAGDFYGAALRSSGRMEDLMGQPSGNFTLALRADDLARIAQLAGEKIGSHPFLTALADDPGLSTGTELDVSLDARPLDNGSRGTIGINGVIGGTRIEVRDRFEGKPQDWRELVHELSVKLEQPQSLVLAQQLALPVLPVEGPGPVSVDSEVSGSVAGGLELSLDVSAPQSDLSLRGGAGPDAEGSYGKPELNLSVTAASGDIEPWLQMAGYPLPGTGLGTPLSLSSDLFASQGRYQAENLVGQYSGVAVSGAIQVDTSANPRPRITGNLETEHLSLPLFAELVLGNGTVAGDPLIATQEMVDTEFGSSMLGGLDGTLSLWADSAPINETQALSQFSGEFTLLDGAVSMQQIGAEWLGGSLSGSVSLKNIEQGALADAQLRLEGADIGQIAQMTGVEAGLSGVADVTASLEANGRSLKALVAGVSGSGVVEVGDGRIAGIRTGGLADMLEITDDEEFEISAANVTPLAEEYFLSGAFDTPGVTLPFAITRGRISVRNVTMEDAQGSIRGEAEYQLGDGTISASVTIEPDPGKESLSGADPALTFEWSGEAGQLVRSGDAAALSGYLSLRAFEREQRRVEMLQAAVLERQRLRREVIMTNARIALREEREREELRKLERLQERLLEEQRKREEAEEQSRLQAEEEARAAEEERREEAAQQSSGGTKVESVQPIELLPLQPAEERPARRHAPAPSPQGSKLFGFGNNQ